METETISGFVEHIVYRNEENGYTVFHLSAASEEEITCVGNLPVIGEGECLELTGVYTVHAAYGPQFQIRECRMKAPEDVQSIERYLGSGAIKGVGKALAARIVKRFGADTMRVIAEEPHRLAEVKGISERKAGEIAAQAAEKKELSEAMLFLAGFGISSRLAIRIYNQYGMETYRVIRENPYRMAEEVEGIGFKTADEIAARAGIQVDSDFRIRSGILYVLAQAAGEGHTYLPSERLKERAISLLRVSPQQIEKNCMDLAVEKKIVLRRTQTQLQVYLAVYDYMEVHTAVMLRELNVRCESDEVLAEHRIRKIEELSEMELDEMQHLAVLEAVKNGLLVITGGPGTGKTTTINTLIRYFDSEGLSISLAAPTGRAAKRMSETTGFEAKTIHRLLEVSGEIEGNAAGFARNEENPLEADVIIIDEMSMVDLSLMHALLKAIVPGTRLILVGDVNQLPSVGAGSVLKDIIASHACHVVRLSHIFRQASKSDIVVNAHRINRGEHFLLDNQSMDFFFLKRYDANVIISICIQLILQKLPRYVQADPFDIQVLTPSRRGLLGVERLNLILQEYLNPPAEEKMEKEWEGGRFRVGDKVMQIRNNYQLEWTVYGRNHIPVEEGRGIFNGDMGRIREISAFDETLTVQFDENRMVEYPFRQLGELELAYAVTIHKSQGSEYPAVIIPLLAGPRMLMNRNLLYTAVTRARKCVTLVGDEAVFYQMIDNVNEQRRFSGLQDRIEEL